MEQKRVVITGMSINTPIGDKLDTFLENLLAGKSAITKWNTIDSSNIYSKIGGDLGNYDVAAKIASYEGKIPDSVCQSLTRLAHRFPVLVSISMLAAVDAFLDAGYINQIDPDNNIPTVVAGHNLTQQYSMENHKEFLVEPDFIDGLFALKALDTNHVGLVSEVLQLKGPGYTVGGACASGNMALRCAFDEVRHNNNPIAIVVAPVLNLGPIDIHGMALMGAITFKSYNETPEKASRPYDTAREGFVPAHGAAALILEDLDHALQRGARIYAEILGVESSTDGSHLPQPSREGQTRLMKRLLKQCKVQPEEVDFICAHATSTPLGDLTELHSIRDVFGAHAYSLKINAPKSMLGHTCWSAATVETVAAILQMNKGELHPSINIDQLDPAVDLDVCQNGRTPHHVNILMKNSFGFGGINSISLIKKFNH
jgi:3-oxoacyl-(acyl-carrier-protein) synthase